jgi:hypothetical protein
MMLEITTTIRPASDLGFLLHKHPGRVQTVLLTFGVAHVFYPEVSEDRCTAALLLDVDPVCLVRGRRDDGEGPLAQYVNDRPYVASSLLSVAFGRVYGSAHSRLPHPAARARDDGRAEGRLVRHLGGDGPRVAAERLGRHAAGPPGRAAAALRRPPGPRPGPHGRAALAAADADDDGTVTRAELRAVTGTDFVALDNYGVGDAPVTDLDAYVAFLVGTLGHIDGEGHCGE